MVLLCPSESFGANERRVAVLYFDNNTGDKKLDVLSKGFADMLITDLGASKKLVIVEREKLQSLIDETKLQKSQFFDKKTAVKVGNWLGASHVVTGSFVKSAPSMRIDVRMIDLKTSKVVLEAKVSGPSNTIFDLEQELAKRFLAKLDIAFVEETLPPTKVPNLKTLVMYSQGLAFIDKGDNKKAAAQLKRVVSLAPSFGLARAQHASILLKLRNSKVVRATAIKTTQEGIYANARSFLASHKLEELELEESGHYIAYRTILEAELYKALHDSLRSRRGTTRIVPRNGRRAVGLVNLYVGHLRTLMREQAFAKARFGSHSRPKLPAGDLAFASQLGLKSSAPVDEVKLLDFLLKGRVRSPQSSQQGFTLLPAPVDLDKRLHKLAMKLSKKLLRPITKNKKTEANRIIHVLNSMAVWHIDRQRPEKGIAQYQQILDRFPMSLGFSRVEKTIKEQLGLEHDYQVASRKKYRKGLAQCTVSGFNAGFGSTLGQRLRFLGLDALPAMEKELVKKCKKAPQFTRMSAILYRNLMLKSASFEDCEKFDFYMLKWLAAGGSVSDSKGYRKNYSDCPAP